MGVVVVVVVVVVFEVRMVESGGVMEGSRLPKFDWSDGIHVYVPG